MEWIIIAAWLIGTLIVAIAPIILIHELGHFVFAKLANVRVEEFGLGYPPRMLKLWRDRGYLEIGTMKITIPRGFKLPEGLVAGIHADAVAARQEDGTYVLQHIEISELENEHPALESPPSGDDLHLRGKLTALEPGTLYSLNWLPMGGFTKMTGEEDPSDPRSLAAQPKRWRIAVMAAGSLFNIAAAVLLLCGAYTAGYPEKWLVEVSNVQAESAAEAAGLKPGDVILAIDGERLQAGMSQLQQIIRAAPGETVELTIVRDDDEMIIPATPRPDEQGYGLLGILMSPWPDRSGIRRYRPVEALKASVVDLKSAMVATVKLPVQLAQGQVSPQEARPASMVGISEVMALTLQQSIEWGVAFPILHTASLISLALGLTNLLPIPALDGGRIFFTLIEALRGRRISPEREAIVHLVGLAILVALMGFIMIQDLINPVIPWSLLK
ncbi:MAG TPA: RIP metalloprotease [Chloroflexi bacterium]|nr:RIP metalloprotease [Chloroflexota bacterium]